MGARTYRFTPEMEKRIEEVGRRLGGLSAQATVALLVAKGLDVTEAEEKPRNMPSMKRWQR